MQPYIFPYIGYFQLIAAVDRFVIHDDVQWIKGGWINRNRILANGQPRYITLPIQNASSSLNINERELSSDAERHKKKILQRIHGAYRKAPYFNSVISLVSRCLACQQKNISRFAVNCLRECCNHIGLDTPFVLCSELDKDDQLRASDRVLEIIRVMKGRHYINPIGGTDLYEKKQFSEREVRLSFIKTRNVPYQQFQNPAFIPFLSIIDVMMFNSKEEIAVLLREYDLL